MAVTTEGSERLKKLADEMRTPLPDRDYIAVTLLADEAGRLEWSVRSERVGLADDDPKRLVREPVNVDPVKMGRLWIDVGQRFVVVNSVTHLYVYEAYLGGNAVVERTLAEKLHPEWLESQEFVRVGLIGDKPASAVPPSAFKYAPNPKLRMAVFKRDGYRCRVCGRSPDDNTDLEIHLHHIRPWGEGGITDKENLITLCHTCHNGLEPHFEPILFNKIGIGLGVDLEGFDKRYTEGVRRWRERMEEIRKRVEATAKAGEDERRGGA